MEMQRRDVLKIIAASSFLGMYGNRAEAQYFGNPREVQKSAQPLWRVFEHPYLSEIAFPLGGIGTGTVSIGGRGDLIDWEICNRPNKGRKLDNTFFSLWVREQNMPPKAFVLESQIHPPYRGGFGLNRAGAPGMPRLKKSRFLGSYPFARIEFEDDRLPLEISLECFNPMIPTDDINSGLPVAIFYWQIKNLSKAPVDLTLMASLQNIAGVDSFGKNLNEFLEGGAFRGIFMRTMKHPNTDPKFGNLALVTSNPSVTYTTRWDRGGWFDSLSLFWNDFADDGRLESPVQLDPSPDGKTDTGSLGVYATLQKNESITIPFFIAWYFPNRENYWNGEEAVAGKIVGNFYANQFADAWEVASYTIKNLEALEHSTRQFHQALFSSTVPTEVLDAVSSQASIIRTNTCFRSRDGKFYGFEGNHDTGGCCPLNCTHVYNYEQSLAFLFPALERTMRDTDFLYNTGEDGKMVFRTLIPLGLAKWGFPHAAADGQMGCIVKLYREWQLSGDIEFLKKMWPKAKLALEYAWKDWDPNKEGVMTGQQHNTYDIEFYGPNPMMGAIYLAALRAAEEMARALHDHQTADEYRLVYERGRKRLDELTWDQEYYIQVYDPNQHQKYQLGKGCLSDQLLGQWMAHVVDLGYVLPEDRVKRAIAAVYKYNFKETLSDHYNPQRIYALGDEAGLLLCSWPKGERPALPFVYSDEVWTGIEYQVAAHLIYEGMVQEGINIVRAVRNRYDGERRNPWNEVECGHHYARAMASWSVLLALTGFHFSAPKQMMSFYPRINEREFTGFWCMDSGWGTYRQELSSSRLDGEIQILYGRATLKMFSLPAPGGRSRRGYMDTELTTKEKKFSVAAQRINDRAVFELQETVNMTAGDKISFRVRS